MKTIRAKLLTVIITITVIAAILCAILASNAYVSIKQVKRIERSLIIIRETIALRYHINSQIYVYMNCLASEDDIYIKQFHTLNSSIRDTMSSLRDMMVFDSGKYFEHTRPVSYVDRLNKLYRRTYSRMLETLENKRGNNLSSNLNKSQVDMDRLFTSDFQYLLSTLQREQIARVESSYITLARNLPTLPWQSSRNLNHENAIKHALNYFNSVRVTGDLIHSQIKELREYVLSGNPVERHEFVEMTDDINIAFRFWKDNIKKQLSMNVKGEETDLNNLNNMIASYWQVLSMAGEIFGMVDSGRMKEARTYMLDKLDPFFETMIDTRLLNAILDGSGEIDDAKSMLYRLTLSSTMQTALILLLLSAFIIAILRMTMIRMLSSLASLRKGAQTLGAGMLEHRIDTGSNDELQQLASFINNMAGNLSEVTISRDYTESILKALNDSIIILDSRGMIISVNQATCALLAYERNELTGRHAQTICAQFWALTEISNILGPNDGASNIELEYMAKDGSTLHIMCSITMLHDIKSGSRKIVVVGIDISERIHATRKLINSKRQWENTFDFIEDPIMILDKNFRIIKANRALARAIGVNEPHIAGLRCFETFCGSEGPHEDCPHQLVLKYGNAHTTEILNKRDKKHYQISVSPYFDETGQLVGSIHISKDITQRKFMEEDLLKHRERLWELVKERTENLRLLNEKLENEIARRRKLERDIIEREDSERRLIGNDLHDGLGQVLTGIGFKTMALERKLKKSSPPDADDAGIIKKLIDEAKLDVKRISGGLANMGFAEGGLIMALEELSRSIKNLFGVECEFTFDSDMVLPSDKSTTYHMYRIAQEATTNAIKYANPGKIELNLSASYGTITLTVRDNGLGMQNANKQTDGLGLKIMKHRAELIGATLEISGRKNRGTLITCRLENITENGDT